jgi:hypothetical protein
VNVFGTGPLSSSAVVRPAGAPGVPINLVVTAGVGQADVSWSAPVSDGGSPITGYSLDVLRATTVVRTISLAGAGTSTTVTGLTNGTAYSFRVSAVNAVTTGASSAASAPVTPAAPATVPGAPTRVVAKAGSRQATVSWLAPAGNGGSAITGYSVQVVTGGFARTVSVTGTGTSTTVTGLANGTSYTFRVSAVNAIGTGAASAASAPVTPRVLLSAPGAPVIGTATSGAIGGRLTAIARWLAPASNGGSAITSYRVTAIQIGANGKATGVRVTRTEAPSARKLMMTLAAGRYRFQVVAVNSLGRSPSSHLSNTVRSR